MKRKLVFDIKLHRPACVLLQAAYGCGESNSFLQMTFDSRDWLVSPTPDMRVIEGTEEQWRKAAELIKMEKRLNDNIEKTDKTSKAKRKTQKS